MSVPEVPRVQITPEDVAFGEMAEYKDASSFPSAILQTLGQIFIGATNLSTEGAAEFSSEIGDNL